jgi:hypothetical protein
MRDVPKKQRHRKISQMDVLSAEPTDSGESPVEELAIQFDCMDDVVERENDGGKVEIDLVRRRRRSKIQEDLIDLAPSEDVIKQQGIVVSPFYFLLEEAIPEDALSEIPELWLLLPAIHRKKARGQWF